MKEENLRNSNNIKAVTYEDLTLSIKESVSVKTLEITQMPGEHACIYIESILDSEMQENDFHGMSEQILLTCKQEKIILFYGIIDQISIDRVDDEWVLYLKAWGATMQMDYYKKNRAFQNPNMMLSALVDEVMGCYKGADYKLHVPDVPIGQIFVQFEETDWEFLKRVLSKYHVDLYPDTSYPGIRYQAGLNSIPEDFQWDKLSYEIQQDFYWLNKMRKNGFDQLKSTHSISYLLNSHDIAILGSQITYKGATWYLASIRRYLSDGYIKNEYCLKQEERLHIVPHDNQMITGTSIDGNILDIKRDRVQVITEIDATGDGADHYWFPYSTVASSSDGSGWHCMPEYGENVRIYFPSDDEKEGYVISSSKPHATEESDSDVKSIATAQGNLVQFSKTGVVIAAGDSHGSLILGKDGKVEFNGLMDLTINAAESIKVAAKNNVTITSDTSIKIINDAGSNIGMKSGEIYLHGNMIFEN